MSRLLAIASAMWIGLLAGQAVADEASRLITVRGQGEVFAAPDRARLAGGVVTQASLAKQALSANNETMAQLFATLTRFEIPKRKLRTAAVSVNPVYQRSGPGGPRRLSGYRVVNTVFATTADLKRLGELLDALVVAGANRIGGISFMVADPAGFAAAARKKALADARRKAALYAGEAGVRLGKVLKIIEQGASMPRPEFARMAAGDAMSSVPTAPGEQRVRVAVTVTYAIE